VDVDPVRGVKREPLAGTAETGLTSWENPDWLSYLDIDLLCP